MADREDDLQFAFTAFGSAPKKARGLVERSEGRGEEA